MARETRFCAALLHAIFRLGKLFSDPPTLSSLSRPNARTYQAKSPLKPLLCRICHVLAETILFHCARGPDVATTQRGDQLAIVVNTSPQQHILLRPHLVFASASEPQHIKHLDRYRIWQRGAHLASLIVKVSQSAPIVRAFSCPTDVDSVQER